MAGEARAPGLTYAAIVRHLRRRNFAVLTTADSGGQPHAVGVEYSMSADGRQIYVMTRRQLKKARNIQSNPRVAVVVPLRRRLLWFLPPPCIQFGGTAEILDQEAPNGVAAFQRFFLGRRILTMYAKARQRGESGVCFLRITPDPIVFTYMVGHSIFELWRRMEMGQERVRVT